MNKASQWRLEAARQVAAHYRCHSSVRAIIVSGSVARGCADRWSDVEIGIFWDALPSRTALHALVQAAGGTAWELDPFVEGEDVQYEEYVVGPLKIDLRHMTIAGMETELAAVVDRAEPSGDRQEIVSAVVHGIPLAGAPQVAAWQTRAASYPDELSLTMIRNALSLPPWWSVPMLAARGDWHLVAGALQQASERILSVLLGLNRLYHPGSKWLARTLAEMPVAPPDLYTRLMRALRSEPDAGAEQMRLLIEESFDLIAQQRPDIDLTAERAAFRYCRPCIDEM